MENVTCAECQEAFTGRIDKKFCSDYCRNSFNNKQNKDQINLIRNVNNRLRKNWRILKKLNPNGKCKIARQKLDDERFNFNYFTNIYTTKSGNVYYFCYNEGYLLLDDGNFALVHRKGEYS